MAMTNSCGPGAAEPLTGERCVCVIIAAWNACGTIERAVRSALAQDETAEVVVVDDASSDDTSAKARAADDGSGRLKVFRMDSNQGPSAARNFAIAHSTAPYLAILDADDFLLPDRFKPMLAQSGWDIIADNIIFVRDSDVDSFRPESVSDFPADPLPVALDEFVAGNISRPYQKRGELGFAKPLIRRETLERLGLGYDESLRLGEDYALYASALAHGARFLRIRTCGYVAVERDSSLSARHRTEDLAALLAFDLSFAQLPGLDSKARKVLHLHTKQLREKLHHRRILDIRQASGRGRAILAAMLHPGELPILVKGFARDKFGCRDPKRQPDGERYLFS